MNIHQILTSFLIIGAASAQASTSFTKKATTFIESNQVSEDQGVAVAVIKNGRIIYKKTFGLRNRAEKLPVNDRTLFAAASTTKAITATMIAQQHHAGELDMYAPVVTSFPYLGFSTSLPSLNEEASLEDLLSHNTGMPRHDWLWILSPLPRENLVRKLKHLEVFEGEKKDKVFLYNNWMFGVAGLASASVDHTSWENLSEEKVFKPLGMKDSTMYIDEMRMRSNWAEGYLENKRLRLVDFHSVAGAGSLNTSLVDMVKWVKMHLSRGYNFKGERVFSASALENTYRYRVPTSWNDEKKSAPADKEGYGLGWFVAENDGERLISHGGNTSGVTTHVSFMPELGLGVIIFTNEAFSDLPSEFAEFAYKELLESDSLLSQKGMGEFVRTEGFLRHLSLPMSLEKKSFFMTTKKEKPQYDFSEKFPCTGSYSHPAYGEIHITQNETRSNLRLYSHQFQLGKLKKDAGNKKKGELFIVSESDIGIPMSFGIGFDDGECKNVKISMDYFASPYIFKRLNL